MPSHIWVFQVAHNLKTISSVPPRCYQFSSISYSSPGLDIISPLYFCLPHTFSLNLPYQVVPRICLFSHNSQHPSSVMQLPRYMKKHTNSLFHQLALTFIQNLSRCYFTNHHGLCFHSFNSQATL